MIAKWLRSRILMFYAPYMIAVYTSMKTYHFSSYIRNPIFQKPYIIWINLHGYDP
ncbi:hypothetical protein SXCC_00779 [Gluconacetobacter sp. SXCC-1]|nr:hypothetical protein SXCC_00779 [Gluconacetobacter sp. SXCC-1]